MGTWLETPVIDQRDKRWARTLMGKSTSSTIGDYGCLLNCASALAGITPLEMNALWMAKGGYQTTPGKEAYAATFDFRRFHPAVPPVADYSQRYAYSPFPAAASARLVKWLKAGKVAVAEVDILPNNNTHDMHYVLAVSAFGFGDSASIIINDPWRADQTTITPRYGVTLARALVHVIYYGEGTP